MGIQERKGRERERRRQQIIVAAKRVFSAKGFTKATMEDIAKEAELSPGTIYLYFKNKDELYASLSLRILQYLNIRLEHLSEDKDRDPKDIFPELRDAFLDVYEFDPMIVVNMCHLQSSETLKNLSPQLLYEIQDLSGRALGIISDLIRQGIGQDKFFDYHPVAVADIIWSLFTGLVLWEDSKKMLDERKNFLKETLNLAFDVIGRGMTK
jgi:AcrR family transcriptional regulator